MTVTIKLWVLKHPSHQNEHALSMSLPTLHTYTPLAYLKQPSFGLNVGKIPAFSGPTCWLPSPYSLSQLQEAEQPLFTSFGSDLSTYLIPHSTPDAWRTGTTLYSSFSSVVYWILLDKSKDKSRIQVQFSKDLLNTHTTLERHWVRAMEDTSSTKTWNQSSRNSQEEAG